MPDILHSAFCTLHSRRPSPLTPRPSPLGFTLVELLIVIVILGVVTAASIPVVLPALSSRGVREAGRIINAHFGSAQALAMANGRAAGIWIERLSNATTSGSANDGAMDLYLAESPQPYAGSDYSSGSRVTVNTVSGPPQSATVTFSETNWDGLLYPGDLIRFNSSGPYYYIDPSAATNSDGTLKVVNPATYKITPVSKSDYDPSGNPNFRCIPPAALSASGWVVTYQILRRPVKSAGSPVQLPTGTVIDLGYSGTPSIASLSGKNPVIITFDRTGALQNLYYTDSSGTLQFKPISEPLYLLIGKRDQLGSLSAGGTPNFQDLENIWVAINPQTGLATTAEISAGSSGGPPQDLKSSRKFAQSAQTMGGR